MKRLFLLSLAALALGVSAQEVSRARLAKSQPARPLRIEQAVTAGPKNHTVVAQKASDEVIEARRAARRRAEVLPTAKYIRPAGSFYGVTADGSTGFWGAPFVFVPTWRDVTFPNVTTDATEYAWTWTFWSSTAIDPEDGQPGAYVTEDGEAEEDGSLIGHYINGEMPDAPTLTATGAGGTATYQMFGMVKPEGASDYEQSNAVICSSLDPCDRLAQIDSWAGITSFGVTPKSFKKAYSEDEEGKGDWYNTVTYRGAMGSTMTDDDNSGLWFGRNWSGWNAMGVRFEKPEYRYALRKVLMQYHDLELVDEYSGEPIIITAKVYKIKKNADRTPGIGTETRTRDDGTTREVTIAAGDLQLGDLICEGSADLMRYDEAGSLIKEGLLEIPMMGFDPEFPDLEFEEPADIDDEIFVMVSGYDHENISKFSMSIASDEQDEGYGYLGYMISLDDNSEPTRIIELENFFSSPLGNTAPTLYIDIEQPMMTWNWSNEDGEVEFPVAGGAISRTHTTTGDDGNPVTETENGLSIFTNKESSEFYTTVNAAGELFDIDDATGEQINPAGWLHLTFEDKHETTEEGTEEFSYVVLAGMSADALPAGVEGREETFFINFPGGRLQVHAVQGKVASADPCDVNEDGKVDVGDVNAVLEAILAGSKDAKFDVNNDTKVDVGDVNTILDAILNQK